MKRSVFPLSIKKIGLVFCFLSLPSFLVFAQKKEETKNKNKKESLKREEEKKLEIGHHWVFSYPKEWIFLEKPSSSFVFLGSGSQFPNLTVKYLPKARWIKSKFLLQEWAKDALRKYKGKYKPKKSDYKIVESPKEPKIKIFFLLQGIQKEKANYSIYQTILFFKEGTLLFTFTLTGEGAEKLPPVVQQVLGSIKKLSQKEKKEKAKKNK